MFWRKRQPEPIRAHRGRIWRDGGWWRYACTDCDYGAGSSLGNAADVVVPWLIRIATDHANPNHLNRRKREAHRRIRLK